MKSSYSTVKPRDEFVKEFVTAALKNHKINAPSSSEIKHRYDNLIAYTYPYKNIYDDIKTKPSLLEISQKPLNQITSFIENIGKYLNLVSNVY